MTSSSTRPKTLLINKHDPYNYACLQWCFGEYFLTNLTLMNLSCSGAFSNKSPANGSRSLKNLSSRGGFSERSRTNMSLMSYEPPCGGAVIHQSRTSVTRTPSLKCSAAVLCFHWPALLRLACARFERRHSEGAISRLLRRSVSRRDPVYMSKKIESFERINSIRETNGNFDSCKRLSRLWRVETQ